MGLGNKTLFSQFFNPWVKNNAWGKLQQWCPSFWFRSHPTGILTHEASRWPQPGLSRGKGMHVHLLGLLFSLVIRWAAIIFQTDTRRALEVPRGTLMWWWLSKAVAAQAEGEQDCLHWTLLLLILELPHQHSSYCLSARVCVSSEPFFRHTLYKQHTAGPLHQAFSLGKKIYGNCLGIVIGAVLHL